MASETDRRLDVATAAIDLASVATAPALGAFLIAQFGDPRGINAIWPAIGLIAFCVAIWLVRRLQPEGQNALGPEESISKPAAWAGMSTIVGTVLLLVAMGHVAGGGGMPNLSGFVGFLLSWVVVAVLFTPLGLLWAGQPKPVREERRLPAEVGVIVAGDLTMLIMVAYFEWVMMSMPGFGEQGPMPAVGLIGLPIGIVAFLLMCGAPRLLLLGRRFSWVGAGSLFASTGLYLIDAFYFWW
jgi:hypothetical protein